MRIDTMRISMYECHDGALRTHLELPIKSLDDIPSRQDATIIMEAKWQRLYQKNQIVNSFNKIGIKSKNDPDYIFEEYKGYTIASHKNNVVGKDIDNLTIVYRSDEFPKNGFIIGFDDNKLSGRRKAVPHNMEDAKAYIDWGIKVQEEKTAKVKTEIPQPPQQKGRKM